MCEKRDRAQRTRRSKRIMRIQGLQKLTLLDYPGKVACTVFTAGCNFRCPFCHNASLVTRMEENEDISEKEFFGFLEKRQGILDGVCVTGGEPLIWDDIRSFFRENKRSGLSCEAGYERKLSRKAKAADKGKCSGLCRYGY